MRRLILPFILIIFILGLLMAARADPETGLAGKKLRVSQLLRKKGFYDSHTKKHVRVVKGEILVKFKPAVKPKEVRQIFAKHSLVQRKLIEKLQGHLMKIPEEKTIEEMIQELKKDPDVIYAEPNFTLQSLSTLPDDEYFDRQWATNKIELNNAWDLEKGNADVTIAVLDSGIDLDHPDLKQNIIPGYDFVNDNSDAWDDNGHGTAIAGVIGAIGDNSEGIAGVDWQSKLIPLKVVDGDGIGTYYDVAQGIIYAADHNARIINLSIGGYAYSYALKDAVDYALEKGCVLVAAVGNDGIDAPMYPAAYEGVIGIAATDSQDRIDKNSNYGDFVDLAAPGLSIYTTEPEGRYGYNSGSSLACSHTAGLVGLILSSNPSLSKDNIEGILYDSCDYIKEDNSYGHGRINAYRALLAAKGIENIDIAILHLEVMPESPFPGQETEISVTLQNQGNVKTPGSILRLYIDDVAVNNATIPSLAPNEVIIKKFNWVPETSRKQIGN